MSTVPELAVNNQASRGEEFETLKREGKPILTIVEDVQYNLNFSTKVNVQHRTARGDVEHGTRTGCEQTGSKGEEFKTLKRKYEAILTLAEDVRYSVSLSTNANVQHRTARDDVEHGTRTCRKQVTCKTRIRDSMALMTTVGDVLASEKIRKGDVVHQTPIVELKTFIKDDNKRLNPYGESMNTFKKDNGTSPTPEGDNTIKRSRKRIRDSL